MAQSFDRHMMGIALRLAENGLGRVAPNPAVGAVIADETAGIVLARAWTQPGGRPHAETEAIRLAGAAARGATLYVTLEPCSHQGKTPPCADAIVSAGLKRVVVGCVDPDTRVAGGGLARLKAAGMSVETGLLSAQAQWLTRGHILRVRDRRPFVQVKMALSAQGTVARGSTGRPIWVTSEGSRLRGHLLRAQSDAILVGARTIADDNPDLRCRLPGLADRSPVRVVLSGSLDLDPQSQIVETARDVPVWVVTGGAADASRADSLRRHGVEILTVAGRERGDVTGILAALAERGITRLLVEGGPSTWRVFADAVCIDEAVIFIAGAPAEVGDDRGEKAMARHLGPLAFELHERRIVGPDTMWRFRRAGATPPA